MNQQSESMFLQQIKWREGHLASKTYRSLLQKISRPVSDLIFVALLASSLRGINIFNSLASLYGNELMDTTKQNNKWTRNHLSSLQKCVVSPIIPSFQFDLEKIFNLIFKVWESFEVNIEIKPSSDSHCGFEALSMSKCCLQPTESNVFFKKKSTDAMRCLQFL